VAGAVKGIGPETTHHFNAQTTACTRNVIIPSEYSLMKKLSPNSHQHVKSMHVKLTNFIPQIFSFSLSIIHPRIRSNHFFNTFLSL